MAPALMRNTSVAHCSLGHCTVGRVELEAWSDALSANRTIKWLAVSFLPRDLEAFGVRAATVPRFIRCNQGIRDLWLDMNMKCDPGDPSITEQVFKAIRDNRGLRAVAIGCGCGHPQTPAESRQAAIWYAKALEIVA